MRTITLTRTGLWSLAIMLGMGWAGNTWASQTQVVVMAGSVYDPVAATVITGQVVQWTNQDAVAHTATSDPANPVPGGPDSGTLAAGGTYSWTVPTNAASGTRWFYHCVFHGTPGDGSSLGAGMAGVITVSGSGGILLDPQALIFNATYQGANPAAQVIGMTNLGGNAFTYTNVITYGAGAAGWLTVLPSAGTVASNGATTLTNQVNIAGLGAGAYYATNQVTAADATNSPQTVVATLTVAKANQTITFPAIPDQIVTSTVNLSATASSGLPVTFAVDSGPAVITGSTTLSFTGVGTVNIVAGQAGNANWNAAANVTNTVTVDAAPPPSAPTGVSASDGAYTNRVLITWNASSGASSYEVWRHTNNSSGSASNTSNPNPTGTNYDDTSATVGATYYYWVKAVHAGGASSFSASDSGFVGVVGPLITANGLVGDVLLNNGDPVTIAVQMMNMEEPYLGVEVDWWVIARAGSSWYYLDSVAGWAQEGAWRPAYQGALFNLSATEVLNITGLPVGSYTFYFAVDYPLDGILNVDGPILVDSVNVTVQ